MADDLEHAFPHQWTAMDGTPMGVHGMTLRDYFAAKAMAALIGRLDSSEIPSVAYRAADAMLHERDS